MSSSENGLLGSGLARLVGSQIFTRLATFALNQIVTKALSVEAFGLLSIRFHLINTSILMLSREGFRRGCLVSHQGSSRAKRVLLVSSWCIPIGALVTILGCWFFGPDEAEKAVPGYEVAILLQGVAAMIELLSEPPYVLALVQAKIGLRVKIEAAATLLKILATLTLMWSESFPEAIALSIAQIVFALVTLIGYAWHFLPATMRYMKHAQNSKSQTAALNQQKPLGAEIQVTAAGTGLSPDLVLCGNFSAQAAEKLLLAEGSKIAMTKVQSAYDQGVYGLVVNLGSIAARLLLQPFEEAAFMSFSQPLPEDRRLEEQLNRLMPLVRVAVLFGLFATAFGPSNTYILLHLLYGDKYSATEAPTALALYCPYILLLSVNGILESFVQAVSRGPQLKYGHLALIGTTLAQGVATLGLVASHGTFGMIWADGIGMALRIAYCLLFITILARSSKTSRQSSLKQALPSVGTVIMLIIAALSSEVSLGYQFGRGWFMGLLPLYKGFYRAALWHIGIECILLSICALAMWRTERSLLQTLRRSKLRKQE